MEYNDFDSFKVNEGKVMNVTNFNEFTIEMGRCKDSIFELYPKYKFVIETKKGTCFVYSQYEGRTKYWDATQMIDKEGNMDDNIITDTENGEIIKEQYEKLSNLTIRNVYQIPLMEAEIEKYEKENKKKNPKRPSYGGGTGGPREHWDWFDRYNDEEGSLDDDEEE